MTAWWWVIPGATAAVAVATAQWGRPRLLRLELRVLGLVLVVAAVILGSSDWRLEASVEVLVVYAVPLTAGVIALILAQARPASPLSLPRGSRRAIARRHGLAVSR